MKKISISILLALAVFSAGAQLSNDQKLFHLCKVWGYLKYHHPNNCSVRWNDLLLEKIDSVVASGSNSEFNSILLNLCLQTGISTRPSMTGPRGDSAINYQTAWFHDPQLPNEVRDFLDSVDAHANPNSTGCLLKANNYSDPNYNSYIDSRKDSIGNVPGFSYKNLKHRLLVYFYYWNTIKYLAPQINIADRSWDSTLIHFMPEIRVANSDSSFELTLAKVVACLDDSHGAYNSRYYSKFLRNVDPSAQAVFRAKLKIARIQNKNVVVASDESDILKGDIITKIDGLDADTFLNRRKPFVASSNDITKYRMMYSDLGLGAAYGSRHLELIDASGTTKQVDLHYSSSSATYSNWLNNEADTLPKWNIGKCGYGYVNLRKLTQTDVPLMYQDLQNAPVIIFDVRNYPQGTLWPLKPLLFSGPNITARGFVPNLDFPGYYYLYDDLANFGAWNNPTPYKGRLIILVNEETQSQAEYTAQALHAHPNAVTMGSQTAGADGNISFLELPNIRTYWTSLGWYERDWYNPQRAGVRVDDVIYPTIAGIRQGKDEVLERAFDCSLNVVSNEAGQKYCVVQSLYLFSITSNSSEPYSVELFNMLGQSVFRRERNQGKTSFDLMGLMPGIYAIVISDGTGVQKKDKISLH